MIYVYGGFHGDFCDQILYEYQWAKPPFPRSNFDLAKKFEVSENLLHRYQEYPSLREEIHKAIYFKEYICCSYDF